MHTLVFLHSRTCGPGEYPVPTGYPAISWTPSHNTKRKRSMLASTIARNTRHSTGKHLEVETTMFELSWILPMGVGLDVAVPDRAT